MGRSDQRILDQDSQHIKSAGAESAATTKKYDFFSDSEFKDKSVAGNLKEQEIIKLVDDFLTEYAKGLYSKDELTSIEDRLRLRLLSNPELPLMPYLKDVKEVFDEREVKLCHHYNVKNRELDIRREELQPGNIKDLGEYMRWSRAHNFDSKARHSAQFPTSITGTEKGDKLLSEDGQYRYFGGRPLSDLRNNVVDLGVKIQNDLKVNNKSLDKILDKGQKMSDKEKAQAKAELMKKGNLMNQALGTKRGPDAQNYLEYGAAGFSSLFRYLTRGFTDASKSRASKTANYQEFIKKRDEILRTKIIPKLRSSSGLLEHLRSEKARLQSLLDSSDPKDRAEYEEMKNLIDQQIKEEEQANEKELADLKDSLNKINDEYLKKLQTFVDQDDQNFPWNLLLAASIIAPFAPGLVFIGPATSYLGFGADLLGTTFAGDFAGGIADIITHPMFGIIGEILDDIMLDDLIEWFLTDLPIVSELVDLLDYILGNVVVQGAMESMMPLLESPLLYFGIASVFATSTASDKIVQESKKSKELTKGSKAKGAAPAAAKLLDKVEPKQEDKEKSIRNFTQKKLQQQEKVHANLAIADFFASNPDIAKTKFPDLHSAMDGKDGDKLKIAILDFIKGNGQLRKAMLEEVDSHNPEQLSTKRQFYNAECEKRGINHHLRTTEALTESIVHHDMRKLLPLSASNLQPKSRQFRGRESKEPLATSPTKAPSNKVSEPEASARALLGQESGNGVPIGVG